MSSKGGGDPYRTVKPGKKVKKNKSKDLNRALLNLRHGKTVIDGNEDFETFHKDIDSAESSLSELVKVRKVIQKTYDELNEGKG